VSDCQQPETGPAMVPVAAPDPNALVARNGAVKRHTWRQPCQYQSHICDWQFVGEAAESHASRKHRQPLAGSRLICSNGQRFITRPKTAGQLSTAEAVDTLEFPADTIFRRKHCNGWVLNANRRSTANPPFTYLTTRCATLGQLTSRFGVCSPVFNGRSSSRWSCNGRGSTGNAVRGAPQLGTGLIGMPTNSF
jgi:hypothetical protein